MMLLSVSDSEFEGTLCRLCGLLSSHLEEEELRNLELIERMASTCRFQFTLCGYLLEIC